jgi:hypothetical protein
MNRVQPIFLLMWTPWVTELQLVTSNANVHREAGGSGHSGRQSAMN